MNQTERNHVIPRLNWREEKRVGGAPGEGGEEGGVGSWVDVGSRHVVDDDEMGGGVGERRHVGHVQPGHVAEVATVDDENIASDVGVSEREGRNRHARVTGHNVLHTFAKQTLEPFHRVI